MFFKILKRTNYAVHKLDCILLHITYNGIKLTDMKYSFNKHLLIYVDFPNYSAHKHIVYPFS